MPIVATEMLYLCVMYTMGVLSTVTWVYYLEGTISRERVPM